MLRHLYKYVAIAAAAAALTACTASNRGVLDHSIAPGHASGRAPAHLMNAPGGGPEVHRPAYGTGTSTGTARLAPTGGGSPEVIHSGAGFGSAGSPYGGRITGNAGTGGPTVQHGHETPERAN